MNKVNCNLTNCFGIENFKHEFDFSENNVIMLYARNGLMKTSFSKTFKKIQDKKESQIKDVIYDLKGKVDITVDDNKIKPEEIFVIKSYESFYECNNISSLLIDNDIKDQINNLLKLKDIFVKELEKCSGLKLKKTYQGKTKFELEPTIVKDFNFEEDSFLLNIKALNEMSLELLIDNVKYTNIFDESVLKKINSSNFQLKLEAFCTASEKIYEEYGFLEKGTFTLPKLKNIAKKLDEDNFFVKSNGIYLEGLIIKSAEELKEKINKIDNKIKEVSEFQEIEKILSDAKGMILKEVIENNPDILPYLKLSKLESLKKQLWLSYININNDKFKKLIDEYINIENKIANINLETTRWNDALTIFKDRFSVPYEIEISNMKGAIIGESIPRVEFSFEHNGIVKKMDRDKLENIDILSQGEKRALYLLNIIFDIENLRKNDREILFIIDDIADSFDYKNKYAIVEYLYNMAKNANFKLLILSHNFDFYRTVSSRLSVCRNNRFCANKKNNNIYLEKEFYQNQPFATWFRNLNITYILALIPFVRNLIEYGKDRNVVRKEGIDNDFLVLTNLLHDKENTKNITFNDLKKLYGEYLGKDKFNESVVLDSLVIDKIFEVAENIDTTSSKLEGKLILAIAIRHKAELYMKKELLNSSKQINWFERVNGKRTAQKGSSTIFMNFIKKCKNQTRELFAAYGQIYVDNLHILEEVNIMTPENIHLNSFMYEPILDMDIIELNNLYCKVKEL